MVYYNRISLMMLGKNKSLSFSNHLINFLESLNTHSYYKYKPFASVKKLHLATNFLATE